MFRFDPEESRGFLGEVLAIEGHDHMRSATDGGREDMAIVGIGESEVFAMGLVALDQAVSYVAVHERTSASELPEGQVGPIVEQVTHPLTVDLLGPARAEEILHGELHEQVRDRGRVEHARVEQCGEHRHVSSPGRAPVPAPQGPRGPACAPRRCACGRPARPGTARDDGCRPFGTAARLARAA